MKLRNKILFWCAGACLVALAVYAANPSFTDFNVNQFSGAAGSAGNASYVNIKSGVQLSNETVWGGSAFKFALANSPAAASSILSISNQATGGTLQKIADGTGALTNDGSGHWGYFTYSSGGATQGGVQTNSILQATNIIGIHDSISIPASSFYSFNLLTPSTNANFTEVTNLCTGWVFADAITNEIRCRFSLPYDWDGGTVQMQLNALCTGTNADQVNQTNVVFAVAAAALPGNADLSSPTFGTAIWVTNRIDRAAYKEGVCYTQPITVGNSPSATKSILWQIQRLGAQGGDTLTNASLVLTETRIFFTRNLTTTNAPTASP